ncbi:MAG: TonB-dependent receptor [Ignavibacteria bacterium]|nr:TonB-dependent receptor [Ignavibacteria bacterium]
MLNKIFKVIFLVFLTSKIILAQSTGCTIAGVVKDSISGQAVIGASVIVFTDTNFNSAPYRGTITNRYGFYSLPNIPAGEYFILVRSLGYNSISMRVKIDQNQKSLRLNFSLLESELVLPEVVIKDKRESEIANQISVINVSPELIKSLPSMSGEVDLFRTLQLLPGIKISTEISNGLYVRGGSPDQTLTLVDGVIVYNPSHLGNFASTFNTDAISDIKLIKGAFPANYGGRLSSVIDIKLREGSRDKSKAKVGLGMISSNFLFESPLAENSTIMLSGRRMYYDRLQNLFYSSSVLPRYNFYDFNGKLTYNLNESNWLTISGFFGNDKLYASDKGAIGYDINWGNKTLSVGWTSISSPILFSTTSISYTNYKFQVFIEDRLGASSNYFTFSDLTDFSLKRETEFFPSESNLVKFGAEVSIHNFKLTSSDFYLDEVDRESNLNNDQISLEGVLYATNELKLTNWFSTNLGGRVYYFKERKRLSLEPRLSLSFIPVNDFYIRLAYARAHQFLHMITRNDISLPTDLWYPSNQKIEPAMSDQFVLGAETFLFDGVYQVSVEGYYKTLNNILEFNPAAKFSLSTKIEDQLEVGKGEAYGVEFLLNKRAGDLNGWIGYTLSWTKRKFDEINRGKIYYPRYDRRHDVSIVLSYSLLNDWNISATWIYGTGQAYTLPTGQFGFSEVGESNQNLRFDYLSRNTYRLPDYHKLDLSIGYKFKIKEMSCQANLSFFNLYNRKNPFAQYITYEVDPSTGEKIPKLKQLTLFPFIPAFSISAQF